MGDRWYVPAGLASVDVARRPRLGLLQAGVSLAALAGIVWWGTRQQKPDISLDGHVFNWVTADSSAAYYQDGCNGVGVVTPCPSHATSRMAAVGSGEQRIQLAHSEGTGDIERLAGDDRREAHFPRMH